MSQDSIDSIKSTNFRIPPLLEGQKLWESVQKNQNIRYCMSQTETNFISHKARLALQETHIDLDSVQPSRTELHSKMTISSIKYKSSGRGRPPEYLFPREKYIIEKEEQYLQDVAEAEAHIKLLRNIRKMEEKRMHDNLINANGPAWYQEPSLKQRSCAEQLDESIQTDKKLKSVYETSNLLLRMGLTPLPSSKLIWKAIKFSEGDPVQFLLALFRLINPSIQEYTCTTYTIRDRIILSAMTHLALPSTLREMHIRIPSPPPPAKKSTTKKPKPKPKKVYESPYLEPYTYKRPPIKIVTTSNVSHPNSPYFNYIIDLKRKSIIDLPEKSEYKYKHKIEELDKLIKQKLVAHHSHSSLSHTGDTSGDDVTDEISGKPSDTLDHHKVASDTFSVMKHNAKRSKKRKRRKFSGNKMSELYTYHPIDDLNRQPTHYVVGGTKITNFGVSVPIIEGISKMDYQKRVSYFVIGGISILPDGSTVPIINSVSYELVKRYTTLVHGGIRCQDGESVKMVTGISTKKVPDDKPEESRKPEVVLPMPYCQCTALFNEYVRLKELEHQRCLNVFRQYALTKAKKVLKSSPEITYVVGGVTETDKGPVYILSGIQPPKNPNYEPVVGGVTTINEQPTLIISGIQATRLYSEYLESLKRTLEKMEETSIIINGVTTLPDGTSKFIVSGVTITQPTRDVKYQLEGVHYSGSKAVVVTDEGVTNPWLKDKFTTVISGITPASDGQPIHIVQGMAKHGFEEPKYTYVIEGVKQTETGDPLFVISGVRGGEVVEEMFKPKCEYLIGGIKEMPDNTKVLVVQGLVIDRDEIPQPCTYVIGGVKQLPDGSTVNIIQYTSPRKPIDCECLDLYRKYIEIQENKHKKCMDLYKSYLRKKEREEKEALKERLKPKDATYIIGGIEKSVSGDPRFIITGLAANKLVDAFQPNKLPEMTQPVHPIIGGVKLNRDGTSTYIIQGHTEHLAGKKPFVVIGGTREVDGSPTYVITGVQAVPSVTNSICEFKRKKMYEHRETIMIVGGINQKPDGVATFTIDGIATYPIWKEDESENQKDFICKCMRIYNRWLELELTEYDEEIIEGVGRRVDDIIVPFIDELPTRTKPLMPKTIDLIKMPKKYYKISCDYKTQIVLLKQVLFSMANDGYPIALLPKPWLLPYFRTWMNKRCGKAFDDKEKWRLLLKSRKLWGHFGLSCQIKGPKPKWPLTQKETKALTWGCAKTKTKIAPVLEQAYNNIQQQFVNRTREFWPSLYPYDFPNEAFLDAFYAYNPSAEPDVYTLNPYDPRDQKPMSDCRCKLV